MFTASADLYDLIYSQFKDYSTESARIAALIRAVNPEARRVLDVACGTGEHARLLSEVYGFEVDGLDLDPAFVRIAQEKLPRGKVTAGDMITFDVDGRYDAVLCLFSAIGYVGTVEKVVQALRRMRAHLAPAGVVIVEPWFSPGVMEHGHLHLLTAESDGLKVCRMSRTQIAGRISRLQFEYLIGRPTGIERASEIHELGLFTHEEMMESFREAGLSATYDEHGIAERGLYLARAA